MITVSLTIKLTITCTLISKANPKTNSNPKPNPKRNFKFTADLSQPRFRSEQSRNPEVCFFRPIIPFGLKHVTISVEIKNN